MWSVIDKDRITIHTFQVWVIVTNIMEYGAHYRYLADPSLALWKLQLVAMLV